MSRADIRRAAASAAAVVLFTAAWGCTNRVEEDGGPDAGGLADVDRSADDGGLRDVSPRPDASPDVRPDPGAGEDGPDAADSDAASLDAALDGRPGDSAHLELIDGSGGADTRDGSAPDAPTADGSADAGAIPCGPCGPEQVCYPSGVCAPDRGGPCGEMSGLQTGAPWPMHGYCPTQQRRSPFVGPTEEPYVAWSLDLDGDLRGAEPLVVAVDGTVYVATVNDLYRDVNSRLYAISADGRESWRQAAQGEIRGIALGADDTIYTNCQYVGCLLRAFRPDGADIGSFGTILGTHTISQPPLCVGETIYVAEFHDEVADGRVWRSGALHAMRPDGVEDWLLALPGAVVPQMAIGLDGTIYQGITGDDEAGTYRGTLFAIAPDGGVRWRFPTESWQLGAGPAIGADGTVYVGSGSTVYAVRPEGTSGWTFRLNGLADNLAIGPDGTVYVAAQDHLLYAIRPDGELRWTVEFPGDVDAPTVDAAGTIYAGWGTSTWSLSKAVWAIRADGTKLYEIPTGEWAAENIVIGGPGVLYFVLDDGTLVQVREK
jgi:sugar lactone lactonase YvrE